MVVEMFLLMCTGMDVHVALLSEFIVTALQSHNYWQFTHALPCNECPENIFTVLRNIFNCIQSVIAQ